MEAKEVLNLANLAFILYRVLNLIVASNVTFLYYSVIFSGFPQCLNIHFRLHSKKKCKEERCDYYCGILLYESRKWYNIWISKNIINFNSKPQIRDTRQYFQHDKMMSLYGVTCSLILWIAKSMQNERNERKFSYIWNIFHK